MIQHKKVQTIELMVTDYDAGRSRPGSGYRVTQSNNSGIATVEQLIDWKVVATFKASKRQVSDLHALLGNLLQEWVQ